MGHQSVSAQVVEAERAALQARPDLFRKLLIKHPFGRAKRYEVAARVLFVSSRDFQGILPAFWTPSISSPQIVFRPLRHYAPCGASRLRFM